MQLVLQASAYDRQLKKEFFKSCFAYSFREIHPYTFKVIFYPKITNWMGYMCTDSLPGAILRTSGTSLLPRWYPIPKQSQGTRSTRGEIWPSPPGDEKQVWVRPLRWDFKNQPASTMKEKDSEKAVQSEEKAKTKSQENSLEVRPMPKMMCGPQEGEADDLRP